MRTAAADRWAAENGMAWCEPCRAYGSTSHLCTDWDGPPCEEPGCDEPTVFVVVAAQGTGRGYTCRAGHYRGTCRELTVEEVR